MRFGSIGHIWQLIREVNLRGIMRGAEAPFALWMVGDPAVTAPLAGALSGGAAAPGLHPWIALRPPPLPDDLHAGGRTVALVVSDTAELSAPLRAALARLRVAGVPTLTVVLSESDQPWAALVRPDEGARVVLPPEPDLPSLRERLAPGLLGLDLPDDELALAVARRLPVLRPPIIEALVEDTSRANAWYAATTGVAETVPVLTVPLAAADIIVLTKNQLVMAFKIALAAGKEGSVRSLAGEVLSVVGGGLLFRQIARELVGFLPVIGLVPKVAVAYAGTKIIGHAVHLWATQGRLPEVDELRSLYEMTLDGGRELARELVTRVRRGETAPEASSDRLEADDGASNAAVEPPSDAP